MELSLGIRLVILLPSFLFLIGFGFKSLIENRHLERISELNNSREIHRDMFLDSIFQFSFESVFLLVANGLIIIFELQQVELGIILILIGLVISTALSIAAHINHPLLVGAAFDSMFFIIGWELGYFWSYGLEKILTLTPETFSLIIGIISMSFGVLVSTEPIKMLKKILKIGNQ